jgi:hypothetical protein
MAQVHEKLLWLFLLGNDEVKIVPSSCDHIVRQYRSVSSFFVSRLATHYRYMTKDLIV